MHALTIEALGAILLGGVFVFAGIEHFVKFGAMRDYLASQVSGRPRNRSGRCCATRS